MNQIAYLECRDGIHNKFYLMTMTDPCGANFTIRWGRIGTEGSSCLQPISNWDKKLHERLSHGYVAERRIISMAKLTARLHGRK